MRVVSTRPYGSDPRDGARVAGRATAIASIAAGMVHVSAAADHGDLPLMMAGFEIVAILQVALGCVLFWRLPGRTILAAGLALMVCSIALWIASRTVGLGGIVSGAHAEPVGFRDSVTVAFELAACVGLGALLFRAGRPAPSALFAAPPLGLVGALAVALGIPAVLSGGHGHSPGHPLGSAKIHAGLAGGAHDAGSAAAHSAGRGQHARGGGDHGDRRAHRGGHSANSGGGGHVGHTQLASAGHGHAALAGAGATHPHAVAPATAHPHTVAGSGSGHTAAGGTHDGTTGHPPPSGGGATHPPGHEPAPPAEEPAPEPTLTEVVEDEIDKLVPDR